MKRLLFSALLATAGLAGSATAQNEADVWILHGINGTDLASDEAFPVDIQLNDAPLLAGVPFRARTDAYQLAPGTYNIKISAADPVNPYSQPPVIDVDVTFAADENYTVIAHLTDTAAISASVFMHDLSKTGRGESRAGIYHTANAPAVDVSLNPEFAFVSPIEVPGVTNGLGAQANLMFGFWDVSLNAAGTMTTVFQSAARFVGIFQYYGVYFVGSLNNGTFEVLLYKYPIEE